MKINNITPLLFDILQYLTGDVNRTQMQKKVCDYAKNPEAQEKTKEKGRKTERNNSIREIAQKNLLKFSSSWRS